ncbi:hypothetical protein PV04_08190 [Phialophora macrospora]|uniref:Major facilitator superfamily (MFS) profile domain-containing protein n=1 Tax=Phialophora macrospora TaxID=1851006 RepID=A0A0D2DV59_9EURO|nr:hypothetical protein PV04_08190 [Phialophora macrospora]
MSGQETLDGEKDVIEDHFLAEHRLGNNGLTKEITHPDLHRPTSTLSRIVSRLSTREDIDPGPPPDGGLKAWTQVAIGFTACFCAWGFINSFGVFQTYYTSSLGEAQSTISWVGSVQLWVVFMMSTFSGRALDAGLLIPTFIIGCTIQLFGIFMTSLCTVFWQLVLAQGFCCGLGAGIFFCPTIGVVTTYFDKNRGLAVAILSSGNSVGGAVYPFVVRQLLPKIGFAWTVRVVGFVNLVLLGLCLAFLRPRLPPRKSGPLVEWKAFTEAPYLCLVVGTSFLFGGLFFTYYYLASFGRDILHMSYTDSLTLLIVFNAAGIPIRLATGYIADRFLGPLNLMVPLMFINALFSLCWIAVKSETGMYVFAMFYGFSAGAFQCLLPTVITSLNDDPQRNGIRMGMAFSFLSFAGLAGPPIGGALLATNGGGRGGYLVAQLCLGISMAVGGLLMCAARVYQAGWSLKVKC